MLRNVDDLTVRDVAAAARVVYASRCPDPAAGGYAVAWQAVYDTAVAYGLPTSDAAALADDIARHLLEATR